MGLQWVKDYPAVRTYFADADRILQKPISTTVFEGPLEKLTETANSQPAIFILNCACHALWKDFHPSAVAGHSLGEFSALVACGALDFADGLRLVEKRAGLMQESAELFPGAMLAVLGLEIDVVEKVIDLNREKGIISLANLNCPGQVVLSCEANLVKDIEIQLRERGAKKVVRLPVSGGFHSPLVAKAADSFAAYLSRVSLQTPDTPLVSNFSGKGTRDAAQIKENLTRQMSSPVRWEESVNWMLDAKINVFVELGPGKVLQGLVRRISRTTEVRSMEDTPLEELQAWLRSSLKS